MDNNVYYLSLFLWIRSLGRALLDDFGSGSLLCFIQVVAGAGMLRAGWAFLSLPVFLEPFHVVCLHGIVHGRSRAVTLLIITGPGHQQECPMSKAKATSPFLTAWTSLLHFIFYKQVS